MPAWADAARGRPFPELSHLVVVYERRLAAGMSISGVRTAYDDDEVAEVARLAGARPARRPAEAP